jgi:hypothetical protein
MPIKTIAAIVAGTGFEGRQDIIRSHCKEGALVELRREPQNKHDPEAIGVWMQCSHLMGLIKTWRQIGYIKAARADRLATQLDDGSLIINKATVRSFNAPSGREHPRVSLEIEATTI